MPYYEITERLPIMLVAAAIAYRAMMRGPERRSPNRSAGRARSQPARRTGARPGVTMDWQEHTFVFIGGLHRSGTTLLARCMAEHPR